jgi:hypothetical protein
MGRRRVLVRREADDYKKRPIARQMETDWGGQIGSHWLIQFRLLR